MQGIEQRRREARPHERGDRGDPHDHDVRLVERHRTVDELPVRVGDGAVGDAPVRDHPQHHAGEENERLGCRGIDAALENGVEVRPRGQVVRDHDDDGDAADEIDPEIAFALGRVAPARGQPAQPTKDVVTGRRGRSHRRSNQHWAVRPELLHGPGQNGEGPTRFTTRDSDSLNEVEARVVSSCVISLAAARSGHDRSRTFAVGIAVVLASGACGPRVVRSPAEAPRIAPPVSAPVQGPTGTDLAVEQLMRVHDRPGLAAAVTKDGVIVWHHAYGFSDRERADTGDGRHDLRRVLAVEARDAGGRDAGGGGRSPASVTPRSRACSTRTSKR